MVESCSLEYLLGDFMLVATKCQCGTTDEAPTVSDTLGWL